MNRLQKAGYKIYFKVLCRINPVKYKRKYPQYLRKLGIQIPKDYFESGHGFISESVVFDANDYSLISIGKATTISADVIFLTHDYSISKGLKLIDPDLEGRFLKPIHVGENCFIGMRTMLLPGTIIGNNVIVGAGSIVKGKFPDNVVIAGNPAHIIASTKEWAKKHYEKHDYIEWK